MINRVDILIVDDRPENLLAMEAVLSDRQLAIHKASSGNEALGLMLETSFAVVILDVQMPDMNGYETAALMKENELTRDIPIIFATALNKEQRHVFKGYASGAVDYLFKPIDPEVLRSKVRVFSDLHRQKRIIQTQLQEIEEKNRELEARLQEIQTLRGLLPICAACKKIRCDNGYWEAIEVYLQTRSDLQFTHGICPGCARRLYPEIYAGKDQEPASAGARKHPCSPDLDS